MCVCVCVHRINRHESKAISTERVSTQSVVLKYTIGTSVSVKMIDTLYVLATQSACMVYLCIGSWCSQGRHKVRQL